MENRELEKKSKQPEELDEKLLADVSGGMTNMAAEVIKEETREDERNVPEGTAGMVCPVGAIEVE